MNFKYFNLDEFACHETGENNIDPAFVLRLDELREKCGFPFHVVSGYRSPNHSIEAAKERPGVHAFGKASDIKVENGIQRRRLVAEALKMGFAGIGVAHTYIHVDDREMMNPKDHDTTAVMWTY